MLNFDNIGRKLKKLLHAQLVGVNIICILTGIVIIILGCVGGSIFKSSGTTVTSILIGLAVAVLGPVGTWFILSWLYAYADMVDNAEQTRETTEEILKILQSIPVINSETNTACIEEKAKPDDFELPEL